MVGHDVIRNEKISTQNAGQAQLLFTDQSTLTVAKNSEIVIDEFVFDPEKQAGNLSATLTTGVFRYVGGKISKQQDVTFLTPTGSISVRGGMTMMEVNGNTVRAVFLHGDHMSLTVNGVTVTTTKPGTVIISTSGGPPSQPAPAGQQLLQELSQELQALQIQPITVDNEIVLNGVSLQELINTIIPLITNPVAQNFVDQHPQSPPQGPTAVGIAATSTAATSSTASTLRGPARPSSSWRSRSLDLAGFTS
jgi:translation elongation factor EF-1alpha